MLSVGDIESQTDLFYKFIVGKPIVLDIFSKCRIQNLLII